MIAIGSPGPGPLVPPLAEFGLCSRKPDNFSRSGPQAREGKRAVLRRLEEDNKELRRHISELSQQIAATEAENRIIEQSLQFFQQQLANFGLWPAPSEAEDVSPAHAG